MSAHSEMCAEYVCVHTPMAFGGAGSIILHYDLKGVWTLPLPNGKIQALKSVPLLGLNIKHFIFPLK